MLQLVPHPPEIDAHADGGGDPVRDASFADSSEERALVAKARAGNTAAWSELYHLHYPLVFRRLRLMLGARSPAEDLAQETFVRAMLDISRFEGRSRFRTWLCGIALNLVRGWWRRHSTTNRIHNRFAECREMLAGERDELPDQQVLNTARTSALYAALDELPENLRAAFVLRDLEGISPEEGGEQLGITPGNFAVRATRARAKIREILVREGWPEIEP